ncbi:unnamed protein product [Rotaria socialis]|uniref:Cystinosin n=1 Tax=Rotaria socialis TaxID=392032 RepID=A0A818I282_9BILA|nr:unnamed protein product [Rotaria socialis]CAF4589150.1 unnamed protein product [Rotaria socialis]
MESMHRKNILLLIFTFFLTFHRSDSEELTANNHELLFNPASLTVSVGRNASTTIQLVSEQDESIRISFVYGEDRSHSTDYIKPLAPIDFRGHSSRMEMVLIITGLRPGHVIVGCNVTPAFNTNLTDRDFLLINIALSAKLDRIINIIGWLSFATWSFSFYPQIVLNFRRQSVVGLSFDFLALNMFGYFCYSVSNIGFYSWKSVQDAYVKIHPHGVIPVLLNDVVFGLHGFIASFLTIFQCVLFQHSGQQVSYAASILLFLLILLLSITTILTSVNHMNLLLLMYFYSYVKLAVCAIKYIPQVLMNRRRKSTEGWSIGNVIFDFLGGILSLIQMCLFAINYNDWLSLFGSITKFGLAIVSITFDIVFIVQHYVLYKNREHKPDGYQVLDNNEETTAVTVNS